MNNNDRDLAHYAHVFQLVRVYAEKHARRGMVLCNAHVPSGGLVRGMGGCCLISMHSHSE